MAAEDRRNLRDALLAVLAFSATLPLTQVALESFAPLPMTFGRLLFAVICALAALLWADTKLPRWDQLGGLALVALGGVLGFPLLMAFALEHHASAPAAIPTALIPLATPVWSRLRGQEAPRPQFWIWAIAGSLILWLYLRDAATEIAAPELILGCLAAAVAYAEGGRLAREMPGWQVMAWALMLASPISAVGFGYTWAGLTLPNQAAPWLALAFLGGISQFGAFWLWYRALARGVARNSQVQLLQPFFTLLLCALLLGESLSADLWLFATGVVLCIFFARNASPHFKQSLQEENP